jgi:hypothetical protein
VTARRKVDAAASVSKARKRDFLPVKKSSKPDSSLPPRPLRLNTS